MLSSSRNLHGKQNSCQEAMEWRYKLLLSVQCIPILWFIFTFNRIINHLFPRLPSCICEMWGWPAGRWGASGGDSPGLSSHQAVLAADTRVFSDDTNTLTVVITHWHTDSARLQTPFTSLRSYILYVGMDGLLFTKDLLLLLPTYHLLGGCWGADRCKSRTDCLSLPGCACTIKNII